MATPNILNYRLDQGHTFNGVYYSPVTKQRSRGGMTPKAIFVHIQEGYNWGSWTWFRQTSASATVMIAKNGDIWQVVSEEYGPWTNGDVSSPTAKGAALINKYGGDPNQYTLSIETEGFTEEWPKPQVQLNSVIWQIKTWMKKYNLTVNDVYRHADVNQDSRPFCPGNSYFNYIIASLKSDTTLPTTPNTGSDVPSFDGSKDVVIEGKTYHADKRNVTLTSNSNVRQWASTESEVVGTASTGSTQAVLGWVEGEEVEGVDTWWILGGEGRLWTGLTKEVPKNATTPTTPTTPTNPTITVGKNIYEGRVFYSAGADEKGREVTLSKDAPSRVNATKSGKVVKNYKKGDKVQAYLWCLGDEQDGEKAYWLVGTGKEKNPFKECARLNVSATTERPR